MIRILLVALVLGAPAAARADGEVTLRGVYYKEESTRVTQPMIDARLEVGHDGELAAHALVDSISSASVASGATGGAEFDETRYELGAAYLHRIADVYRLGAGARVSTEPDYKSAFGSLRGEAELAQRNTRLAFNLGGGRDSITNERASGPSPAPIDGVLYTSLASGSVTQVLSPVLVGRATYDVSYLSGFQENPYRTVVAGGGLEPERVPDTRLRHALAGSLRFYLAPSRTTLFGGYRFYADDWGILGHTPEVRVIQDVFAGLDVHLRYRFHRQSAADFYQTIYDSADPSDEPHLTGDVKLGPLTSHTVGSKVDVPMSLFGVRGLMADLRVEALFEYVVQSTYFGNAVVAQLAVTIPISY